MLDRARDYLVLPSEVTPFEHDYLRRVNRTAMILFALHPPILMIVAGLAGTGVWSAAWMSLVVLAGPWLAMRGLDNRRHVSMVHGVTAMLFGALLVHFGQGQVQIEMHFYFFVLLALLAVTGNPMVVVGAALTVVAHHTLLYFLLPTSVLNYEAQFWVVGVHTLFVFCEAVASVFVARTFFDNVIGFERLVAERTEKVNRQAAELETTAAALQERNDELHQLSELVASEVRGAAEQLRATSDDFAREAERQRSATQSASTAVSQNAKMAEDNRARASRVKHVAESAHDAMSEGQARMDSLQEALGDIESSSAQVVKIIEMIEEVAYQTSLLSLNAAVEAARAGRRGRGFAVVAQEVRNLAERSTEAARDSADLVQKVRRAVQAGVSLGKETSASLREVVEQMGDVQSRIAEMNAASGEQVRGLTDIQHSVSTIASSAETASFASTALVAAVEVLHGQTDTMQDMLQNLNEAAQGTVANDNAEVAPVQLGA